DFRWISKKLHIGGVQFFYHFGVHTVRRNDRKIVTTNKMKSFYDAINLKKIIPCRSVYSLNWCAKMQ
ncbi:MAG: hypothetical protein K9K37_08955, partial [Desulfocapsa sp.]|nr:hypothetical protein [Desulfocapsa sp.]